MNKLGCFIGVISCVIGTAVSQASLSKSFQFNGKGNWSIDGVGSNNTKGPIGDLRAIVPTGSKIVKAYLYCARDIDATDVSPTIVLDGHTYGPSAWTGLGNNNDFAQTYRADITAQVKSKIGSGSASMFTFTVDSEDDNFETDGEALVIVYSNPNEQVRTIAILDGFSAVDGDSTTFSFAHPLVIGKGFQALMSLGIGYSNQIDDNQSSTVDIDGRRLTSAAGGQDDGDGTFDNGTLITIGGIGDDPANPPDPFAAPDGYRSDDELYDLAQGNGVIDTNEDSVVVEGGQNTGPFLHTGQTSFTVETFNESGDDNIFFLGLNITAQGSVSGGSNNCSSTSDLMSKIDSLELPRGQALKLAHQISIIAKAIARGNEVAARADCAVLDRWLNALVRSGSLSSVAADNIASCCDTLASTAGSVRGGGGGGNDK